MSNIDFDKIDNDIEDLIDFSIESMSEGIIPQKNLIESKIKNSTSESIYESLSSLYNRIRSLEDLKNYIKTFLIKDIKDKTVLFKEIIEEIESISLNENILYQKEDILFENYGTNFEDKDGTILAPSFVKDNKLSLSYDNLYNSVVDNYMVYRDTNKPYKSTNIKNLLNSQTYRTMYVLKDCENDGVEETIVIKLKTEEIINNIDIDLNNCKIKTIKLIDVNRNIQTYNEKNIFQLINNKEKINEIHITISSKNYENIVYNKDTVSDDFFTSIKEGSSRFKISSEYDLFNRDSTYIIDQLINKKSKSKYSKNFYDIDGEPNFNSLDNVYRYIFGINSISINYVEKREASFFLSKNINIDNNTYKIELKKDDFFGDGTIEYFFVKNNNIIYIPNSDKQNKNEYYFGKFNNEPSESEVIVNNKKLNKNLVKNGDIITYLTEDDSFVEVSPNDNVKVGAILRTGSVSNPYINKIEVMKYRRDKNE